jgi:hypothetical protein
MGISVTVAQSQDLEGTREATSSFHEQPTSDFGNGRRFVLYQLISGNVMTAGGRNAGMKIGRVLRDFVECLVSGAVNLSLREVWLMRVPCSVLTLELIDDSCFQTSYNKLG